MPPVLELPAAGGTRWGLPRTGRGGAEWGKEEALGRMMLQDRRKMLMMMY